MKEKKGQVTIFIIIGVIVIALIALIYLYYPEIVPGTETESKTPSGFIQNCLEEKISEAVDIISSQGGSIDPELYFKYKDENIAYLCYTNEYYKTCVTQQPLLKKHIESEIEDYIKNDVISCFDSLVETYEKRGYNVNLKKGAYKVELLPNKIMTTFNSTMTLSRDSTENYQSFNVILNNNLYEMVAIANSILDWEANYGDSETTTYMDYYHDMKVEKYKQSDGTTLYILTERDTQNKFQFASRSVAWPPGYGTNLI